jgi:hypothetical protein
VSNEGLGLEVGRFDIRTKHFILNRDLGGGF